MMKKSLHVLLVGLLVGSAFILAPASNAAQKIKVGMAYDIGGTGDKSFNDSAAAGLLRSKKSLGITAIEVSATVGTQSERETRLRFLLREGCNPVIAVGYRYADALKKVATEYPNISFAIINDSSIDLLNVASLVFSTNESAYLAGVAAALASKSGKVGYIGSLKPSQFDSNELGFIAGVKATNSKSTVMVKYLSSASDFSGYSDPAEAKAIALNMISAKVDVIYAAADGSAAGTFAAASGKKVWTIGSDVDQYLMATDSQRKNMLTSTIKRADLATYDFIATSLRGSSVNDVLDTEKGIYGRLYTLEMGGVELSNSGGFISKFKSKIGAAKSSIISGKIVVPTTGQAK
ncbi:MAG: BMP family ABC transporter substrate-binding protein [Actinobacteria bacterium]|nr:BMP family ABC transporter substrate-binding protein [Actinomycetota bacterium]MTB16342.1 BMP family ABC transporter substrate-binding protein [Actinomycetota bacterium]